MIYAVEILDRKFIKIGFSVDDSSSARIAQLQTGNPFEIKPIFAIPGTLRQEQTLHGALSAAFGRIRLPMPPNEWYPGRNPFFTEFLECLALGFEMGLAFAERYNAAVRQPGDKGPKTTVAPNIKWPMLKEDGPKNYQNFARQT